MINIIYEFWIKITYIFLKILYDMIHFSLFHTILIVNSLCGSVRIYSHYISSGTEGNRNTT